MHLFHKWSDWFIPEQHENQRLYLYAVRKCVKCGKIGGTKPFYKFSEKEQKILIKKLRLGKWQ